jgi:hypothetical protein
MILTVHSALNSYKHMYLWTYVNIDYELSDSKLLRAEVESFIGS